jgi:C-terminal of Roc, COR, domain/Ras of Complex, Roc, domain of DAPkinase/Leucine rich repeat
MTSDKLYQRALQKVEEVQRSGQKELDLSEYWDHRDLGPYLAPLLVSVCQLRQLQSLKLSGNYVWALSESLRQLTQLQSLTLSGNQLTALPESLGQLTQLLSLDLSSNQLTALPESLGQLTQLQSLDLSSNQLTALPESLGQLTQLQSLNLDGNRLTALPEWIGLLDRLDRLFIGGNKIGTLASWVGQLKGLRRLYLARNLITEVDSSLAQLGYLKDLNLDGNPLNPELAAAYREGLDAVKRYLRARAEAQVPLNEAKLILIGEGEVGKSCLLGALRGDPWEEGRPTTHGIEIKPVNVTHPASRTEITLNGWDFGGQRVYRPTHQLFFSAPAVYLVVWKPREGPQQGFVKEWIKLVKHREPDAKILVVATHGGPKERQPDIDRQEIWDLFGKDTVIDFFHVESQPPTLSKKTGKRTGECKGIKELKDAIARVAAGLPEMGRLFPKHWQEAREALRKSKEAYLPLNQVFAICKRLEVMEDDAQLLLRICRRVGDLIHYEHDPALRDIVVLKPDWLATAISFVLDDEQTRKVGHGLVSFERLGQLWSDPGRPEANRYPTRLHPIFLRLMERFDLSYRIAEAGIAEAGGTSLIAQLVPDVRPDPVPGWPAALAA